MTNRYIIDMKRLLDYLKPYLTILLCYIIAITALKIYETVNLLVYERFAFFDIVLRALAYYFIANSVFVVILFVIYAFIRIFSAKVSYLITSFIYGLLVLAEISLSIFTSKSGALMGCEIILRPFSEMMQTVISVIPPYLVVLICVTVIGVFIFIAYKAKKIKIKKGILWSVLIINIVSLIFIGNIKSLNNKVLKPAVENYIVCKSYYCVNACVDFLLHKNTDIENDEPVKDNLYDEMRINSFLACNPDYKVNDKHYPLERKNEDFEVLSPYFKKSDIKPNIVLIIVESLGREWSGDTELGVSFTPFVDSLSQHSLYWKNCLSTAKRSFGVVPALTGSVPHGPKGFQFGNMPDHNSLISILRENGYRTNAFYAGDFSFDCVYEYLLAERTDYMSTQLQNEYFNQSNRALGTYWGYHDKIMFTRSLEELEKMETSQPKFNLYITISAHDDLNIRGPEEAYYIEKTKEIINNITNIKKKNNAEKNLKHEASVYYTDCALRDFLKGYSNRSDFENTIFIITGDHAVGINEKNRIGFYHVPLIIYSPLLNEAKKFPSLVTHNDVTPSIVGLLNANYGLMTPEYVHWVGRALDTSRVFRSDNRLLFLDYSHEIGEILYDDYFYWKEKDAVYQLDEDMNLTKNNSVKNKIKKELKLYKYINNYVYLTNHLTSYPIYEKEIFNQIINRSMDSLVCYSLDKKPSIEKPAIYKILNNTYIANKDFKKIRMTLSADIMIEGNLWQDKQMNLVFACNGTGMKSPKFYKDKIVKFLDTESIENEVWYKLEVTKDFDVREVSHLNASIYIKTQDKDEYWASDNILYMKNMVVTISECK